MTKTKTIQKTELKDRYIEYKDEKFPVGEGVKLNDAALLVASHFPELSNYQLVVKSGDPNGYVIQPKYGTKG